MQKKNKQKRLDQLSKYEKEGELEINAITKRDLLMLGIGLYWGEGTKSNYGGPAVITNSDPNVILLAMRWFQENFGVAVKDFRPYIYISEIHKEREEDIMNFWVGTLKIPKKQFLRIIFLKNRPKKKYENYDSYYGILSLRVRRSTNLKYKILGLIKACAPK